MSPLRKGQTHSGSFKKGQKPSEEMRQKYRDAKLGRRRIPADAKMRNRCLTQYKSNAKRFNREWALSNEMFFSLISQNCHYCGIQPSTLLVEGYHKDEILYNGVDRVDSSKGYVEGNVVPCCTLCNRCKADLPYYYFVSYLVQAGDHLRG